MLNLNVGRILWINHEIAFVLNRNILISYPLWQHSIALGKLELLRLSIRRLEVEIYVRIKLKLRLMLYNLLSLLRLCLCKFWEVMPLLVYLLVEILIFLKTLVSIQHNRNIYFLVKNFKSTLLQSIVYFFSLLS